MTEKEREDRKKKFKRVTLRYSFTVGEGIYINVDTKKQTHFTILFEEKDLSMMKWCIEEYYKHNGKLKAANSER